MRQQKNTSSVISCYVVSNDFRCFYDILCWRSQMLFCLIQIYHTQKRDTLNRRFRYIFYIMSMYHVQIKYFRMHWVFYYILCK